jgi:hypothetical protein
LKALITSILCTIEKQKKLNGVIIETEVKRHRRMDFISIEPTRVYTKYQLLIDGNMEYVSQTRKYCSKCAVLKRQIVSWRVRLLRRTSNSIEARDENIMISYGTINFEELEMKKNTGNVSFLT